MKIHFYETLCVKKREIQYYAIIKMGGSSFPCKKVRGFLSEGVLSAHLPNNIVAHNSIAQINGIYSVYLIM